MDKLFATERGNTLLMNGEQMAAWVSMGQKRLEITYNPNNYPMLTVSEVDITDEQLAQHINDNLTGWFVPKCNVDGVHMDEFNCVTDPDPEPA